MKTLLLFTLLISSSFAQAQEKGGNTELVLEGNFQGKNLYIQNPYGQNGTGYCVQEVIVNGKVLHRLKDVESSAFEVDLISMDLKIGAPVKVTIVHQNGCTPKVLNPEVN